MTCNGLVYDNNIFFALITPDGDEIRVGECLGCPSRYFERTCTCNSIADTDFSTQRTSRFSAHLTIQNAHKYQGSKIKCENFGNTVRSTCNINLYHDITYVWSLNNCHQSNGFQTLQIENKRTLVCSELGTFYSIKWIFYHQSGNSGQYVENERYPVETKPTRNNPVGKRAEVVALIFAHT